MPFGIDTTVVALSLGHRRFLLGSRAAFRALRSYPKYTGPAIGQMIQRSGYAAGIQALRRLYARQHLSPGHRGDAEVAGWVDHCVDNGQLIVVPIRDSAPNFEEIRTQAPRLTIPSGGLNTGPSSTRSPPPRWTDLPATQKAMELLLRTLSKLPSQSRLAFLQMVSPQALKMMAILFSGWAASHAVGAGEAVDVVLLGVGYAFIGMSAFDAVAEIGRGLSGAFAAKNERQLDTAAEVLAHGITLLGINALLAFLSHKCIPSAAVDSETAVIAQWKYYIGNLKLPFNGAESRAALWSRLGAGGAARAAQLAARDGLVTLEKVLEKTDFMERYRAQFGNTQSATTNKIWEMLSEHYASQLKGTVVVYTDQMQLSLSRIGEAYREPHLGAELFEIMERPLVERVIIKDVVDPSRSQILTDTLMQEIRKLEKSGATPRGFN